MNSARQRWPEFAFRESAGCREEIRCEQGLYEPCSVRDAVIFLIAPLSVANGEAESKNHDSDRRRQHYQDGPVQRPLTFLGRSLGRRITHGAALGERGRSPQRHQQQQESQTRFPRMFHSYFTPSVRTRPASGKKKKYMMMKHAVTENTSIQRIKAVSNFRCMK